MNCDTHSISKSRCFTPCLQSAPVGFDQSLQPRSFLQQYSRSCCVSFSCIPTNALCVYFVLFYLCLFIFRVDINVKMEYEEKIGEKSKDKALQTTLLLSQENFSLHCSRSNRRYDRSIDGDTSIFYSLNDYSHCGNFLYSNNRNKAMNNKRGQVAHLTSAAVFFLAG